MIDIRITKPFAIVHQYDAFVACFVVMSIAVLYEKIEYRHIYQVKQTIERDFRFKGSVK